MPHIRSEVRKGSPVYGTMETIRFNIFLSFSILSSLIGLFLVYKNDLMSTQSVCAPLLCLVSVVCNCTIIGLAVYFFNTFVRGALWAKVLFAVLAAITALNSTFLAFSIFQAQKIRRFEDREEKLEKVSVYIIDVINIYYNKILTSKLQQKLSKKMIFSYITCSEKTRAIKLEP